jgi:hypothetical protein
LSEINVFVRKKFFFLIQNEYAINYSKRDNIFLNNTFIIYKCFGIMYFEKVGINTIISFIERSYSRKKKLCHLKKMLLKSLAKRSKIDSTRK